MSESQPPGQPTEEELRAALEEELRRLQVDDVLLQTVVTLINLGGRRAGLAGGGEEERDPEQVRAAIEAVRALLPIVEPRHAEHLGPVRDALAQLQVAYARSADRPPPAGGEGSGGEQPPSQEKPPSGPGPAQSSGRLWIPGQ